MATNLHRKSEKYLRTHKIIQDDEEIPLSFLAGGKDSAKPSPNFIFTVWCRVSLVCFLAFAMRIFLVVFGHNDKFDSHMWTLYDICILVLSILMFISLVSSLIVPRIKKNSQDNILAIPLKFKSRINIPNKSIYSQVLLFNGISTAIMYLSLSGALWSVETGDLTHRLTSHLHWSYVFISIISAFPMCIACKNYIEIKDNIHHFITYKKVYFNKDIVKYPYDSIEIADLKEIKAIERVSGQKSKEYSYFLQYTSDKKQIFVEVSSKFIRIEHLQELFPQTVITYIEEEY